MTKIKSEVKKIAWGLSLTVGVVFLWYFLAFTNFGLVAAGFNLLGFNDPGHELHAEFVRAVLDHDIPKAEETLKRFDVWESKFNLRHEREFQRKCEEWEAEHGVSIRVRCLAVFQGFIITKSSVK